MVNDTPLLVGIDGGGSKCSAMIFNARGDMLAHGIGGPANAARDLSTSLASIVESIQQALKQGGFGQDNIKHLHVGAGLAGACVTSVNAQLKAWQHPFASFKVSSDLMTACYGAHGGQDGALLIVGTGSSAAHMLNHKLTQFGGHGFILGDKGSGAWLGRSAVSSTLEALDGLSAFTDLHAMVKNKLNVDSTAALVQTMIAASPSEFASLAPEILTLASEGEVNARGLVTEGAGYLDKLCRRTLQDNDLQLVLMGGLAAQIKPWLSAMVTERIIQAKAGPEWGAMRLLQNPPQVAC